MIPQWKTERISMPDTQGTIPWQPIMSQRGRKRAQSLRHGTTQLACGHGMEDRMLAGKPLIATRCAATCANYIYLT